MQSSSGLDNSSSQYNWNEHEKVFFNLNRAEEVTQTRTRIVRDFIYHPLLLESYNELARQNEGHGFVTNLISKIGYPLWNKTIIRDNEGSATDVVLIPFTPTNGTSTSGILVSYKKNNLIKFDIVSRSEFLQQNNGENCFKISYLRELQKFDHEIFGLHDQQIKEAYCDCSEQAAGGPLNPTSNGACPWGLIELCTDGENDSWIGGLCKSPPHLDHDLDCIPNDRDQDFYELSIRFNITQTDWERLVRDFWNEHYEVDYDETHNDSHLYDLVYEDIFSGGQEWKEYLDWLLDWAFDPDHDDIPSWDDFTPHGIDNCDDILNPISGGKVESRTVTCETYYTRICEGQGNSLQWFDIIGDLIPCPGCTNQDLDPDNQLQSLGWHLNNYVDDYLDGNSSIYNDLWPLVQDCPALGGTNNVYACFDEKLLVLAENMTSCLQYSFVGCDESPNGICPETFNFVETGNGYTCEVNTTSFKYFGAENFTMHVGTLCIQTSKRSSDGNFLPPYEASEIMTTAWETAQFLTATEFAASNHSLTNQQFKILFIENLNFAMNGLFQNNTGTSISISNGPCAGNIPKSKPKYSILCF